MLSAQPGTTRITWAQSFLMIFRTKDRRGISGKAYRSPEFHSKRNASQSESHFGNSNVQKS